MPTVNLVNCRIVVEENRAGWVDQAAQDLARLTGGSIEESLGDGRGTTVLVGRNVVRAAADREPEIRTVGLEGLSSQGFVLATVRARDGDRVVCCGGGSRGDAYALIELVKSLDCGTVGELHRREEPYFTTRGMYAHQHWAYSYPYALRSWSLDDWRRYIDLLAYLKVNLFQIWSMAAILPCPLSEGDRKYLDTYESIIDYAKNRRGMEVYIGECANNVAETDGGRPAAERDYFEVETLKNPADPGEFEEIMENRRQLYSAASNADGYWVIDSDPGGYEDSPVSEFVDILMGNRALIDTLTDAGPNAKLVYWMWQGWGKGIPIAERSYKCGEAVELMRDRLKEPWMLLACNETHLEQAAALGLLHKAVFFPYGTVESEPSEPMTRIRFADLYARLNAALSGWDIRRVMGNAQTPFVQIPNIFLLTELAWNGLPAACPDSREVLEKLARLMSPNAVTELTEGWLALTSEDPESAVECSRRLMQAAESAEAGPLGHFYGPGVNRLLSDLALQLGFHACACDLTTKMQCSLTDPGVDEALDNFAHSWRTWRLRHGYSRARCYSPELARIARLVSSRPGLNDRLLEIGLDEESADLFAARVEGEAKG